MNKQIIFIIILLLKYEYNYSQLNNQSSYFWMNESVRPFSSLECKVFEYYDLIKHSSKTEKINTSDKDSVIAFCPLEPSGKLNYVILNLRASLKSMV